jgi:hypothetical protein
MFYFSPIFAPSVFMYSPAFNRYVCAAWYHLYLYIS